MDYVQGVVHRLNMVVSSVEVEGEHQVKVLAAPAGSGGLVLVEVVKYRRRVGYHPLVALKEELDAKGLAGVVFVSLSGFTPDAVEYAQANNIRLLTADDLQGAAKPPGDAGPGQQKRSVFERAFLGKMGLPEASAYFEAKRKKPILGVVGVDEKVDAVEGRFAPVGCFALARPAGGGRGPAENVFFVNLNTCLLYYVYRGITGASVSVKSSNVLRRLMELNEQAVSAMSWIFEAREARLDGQDMAGQPLLPQNAETIGALEALGLVSRSRDGGSILSNVNLPAFADSRYDLGGFLSVGESVESDFGADEITFPPAAILPLLGVFFGAGGEFRGVTYMRYFRCRYGASNGRVRFDSVNDVKAKNG